MRWFGEAVTHNNEDVEALWGFGTAAIAARQEPRSRGAGAVVGVQTRARERGHRHVAGQPEGTAAATGSDDSFSQGHDPLCLQPADAQVGHRNACRTSQKYVDERNRLDEENRKQREEYEKMRAEYEKKYGKPKKKTG